jgi:glutamate synthase domain-containing protein 1
MVTGINGDYAYLSSEESAMRLVSPQLDKFYAPRGGEPVVTRLKNMSSKTIEVPAGGQTQ